MNLKNNTCRCAELTCSDSGILVAAGTASTQPCSGWDSGVNHASAAGSIPLAAAYFPDQAYLQGFCPCEALNNGALFPELVM